MVDMDIFMQNRQQISWSDVRLFLRCQRCFYMSKKMGFKINNDFDEQCCSLASFTDQLLKKEFDHFRKYTQPHPVMQQDGAEIMHPFKTRKIDEWRTAWNFATKKLGGVQYFHKEYNFLVYGGIDDVWINVENEVIVVDYKASKSGKLYLEYIKQIEFYAWLIKKQGYRVASKGYVLMYVPIDKELFGWQLNFTPTLNVVAIDDTWVDLILDKIALTLSSDLIPSIGFKDFNKLKKCLICSYINQVFLAINYEKTNMQFQNI